MEPLYGVLDMLVLRTLLFGPLHGYAIAGAIRDSSGEALNIEFGSLYPALKRLELKGWIAAKWEKAEHNRPAKGYRLTPARRRHLAHAAGPRARDAPAPGAAPGHRHLERVHLPAVRDDSRQQSRAEYRRVFADAAEHQHRRSSGAHGRRSARFGPVLLAARRGAGRRPRVRPSRRPLARP